MDERFVVENVNSVVCDSPTFRLPKTDDDVEKRGLSTAGQAHDSENSVVWDAEGEVIENNVLAKLLCNILYAYQLLFSHFIYYTEQSLKAFCHHFLKRYLNNGAFRNAMKHSFHVIVLMLTFFLIAQVIGLVITNAYPVEKALPLGVERPELEKNTSFISIFIFILLATVIALLLLKFALFTLWRFWFFLSVFFTLTISFAAFIPESAAIVSALILAVWKILKPNVVVHNFTEFFMYGALAAIFVPILSIISISVLLILISLYDYIAVRKTKHMVALAKVQGKEKLFAGLVVPNKKNVAILGGGDIGFPLLFAGVVMVQLGLGLFDWRTYLVPLCTAGMLFALFLFGERKKFYPAMPYLTLGCFLGLGLVLLVL